MGTQSAWGTTIGDLGGKSWAEDAYEEEDEHGRIEVRQLLVLNHSRQAFAIADM